MAMNNGLRSCASKLLASTESFLPKFGANRGFHSTGVKRMGGGHGHGHGHNEPEYLHAKHMYNLDKMKHQKLTMTLGVFTAFSIGVAVPIYAVHFQQKKTASAGQYQRPLVSDIGLILSASTLLVLILRK